MLPITETNFHFNSFCRNVTSCFPRTLCWPLSGINCTYLQSSSGNPKYFYLWGNPFCVEAVLLGIDSQAENCQATYLRGVYGRQADPTRDTATALCFFYGWRKNWHFDWFEFHSLLFNSNMEPRPTPNILHDHPLNNVVKKDWIHVEGLKKEWRSVEQLAKAEPRYHINPYKK